MQLLVQLEGDFLQTQIQLKTPKQEGGEQEVGGEQWELGWEAEEVVAVVEALMEGEVVAVAVGREVAGLLLRPGLGPGAAGVGEEVQVVLGQHQHLKFFSLFPIPIVPFPTVLVVLSLAFPVQVVQVFLGPASPFPVSPFLGALVVPFLGVLSPVVPVLGALFQVFPFLASLSPASPVPFVHDPASPVPAPSAFVALATVFSGCPTLLVMDHFVLEREAVNSVEAV